MPRRNSKKSSPGIGELAKIGFALGIGSMLTGVIFLLFGIAFFIPGFIIVLKQRKLPKEKQSTGLLVTGFILMGLGVAIGLGFGASVFLGLLGDAILDE